MKNIAAIGAIVVIAYIAYKAMQQNQPTPMQWGSTQRVTNPTRVQGQITQYNPLKAPNRADQVFASSSDPYAVVPNQPSTWTEFSSGYAPAFGPTPGSNQV